MKLGESHPDTAKLYNDMAITYSNKKLYDDAFIWYNNALGSIYSENLIAKAHVYCSIAKTHFMNNSFEDALNWYHKALEIFEDNHENSLFASIHIYNAITRIYYILNQKETAQEYCSKLFIGMDNISDKDDFETVLEFIYMAETQQILKAYQKSVMCYVKALELLVKMQGRNNNLLEATIHSIISGCHKIDCYDVALKWLLKTYKILINIYDQRHSYPYSISISLLKTYILSGRRRDDFYLWLYEAFTII